MSSETKLIRNVLTIIKSCILNRGNGEITSKEVLILPICYVARMIQSKFQKSNIIFYYMLEQMYFFQKDILDFFGKYIENCVLLKYLQQQPLEYCTVIINLVPLCLVVISLQIFFHSDMIQYCQMYQKFNLFFFLLHFKVFKQKNVYLTVQNIVPHQINI